MLLLVKLNIWNKIQFLLDISASSIPANQLAKYLDLELSSWRLSELLLDEFGLLIL
jgi:hypothetical protein